MTSDSKENNEQVECVACNGEGWVNIYYPEMGDGYYEEHECTYCNGTGYVDKKDNEVKDE